MLETIDMLKELCTLFFLPQWKAVFTRSYVYGTYTPRVRSIL